MLLPVMAAVMISLFMAILFDSTYIHLESMRERAFIIYFQIMYQLANLFLI